MKKSLLVFLITPFVISCSKLHSIKKEECLEVLNNLKVKYQDINNVSLDMFINTKENGVIKQYAYDTRDSLYYEYSNEYGQDQKWKYFDGNTLITLHKYQHEGNVIKVKNKKAMEPTEINDYFKKEIFQNKMISQIDKMIEVIDLSSKDKEEYLKGYSRDYKINITSSNKNYRFSFFDYQLGSNEIEFLENNKVVRTDYYKFNYEKFDTSVDPGEFVEA